MAKHPYEENDNGSEYQFHEEQETTNYEFDDAPSGQKKKKFAGLGSRNSRLLIIVVGVLIIIAVAYGIMHFRSEGSGGMQPVKKGQNQSNSGMTKAPKIEPAQQFAEPAKTSKQTEQQTQTLTQTEQFAKQQQAVDNKVDKKQFDQVKQALQKQYKDLQQAQASNQSQLSSVQDKLSNLDGQVSNVSKSVDKLSDNIQAMRAAEKARREKAARERAAKQQRLRQAKQYFVSAVIPGRAWLKGVDGSTITVTVGDVIPGYGKITSINPYSGMVMTAKGPLYYGVSSN